MSIPITPVPSTAFPQHSHSIAQNTQHNPRHTSRVISIVGSDTIVALFLPPFSSIYLLDYRYFLYVLYAHSHADILSRATDRSTETRNKGVDNKVVPCTHVLPHHGT